MTATTRFTVLVVDDDRALLTGLGEALEAAGYAPLLADNAAGALALLEHVKPDVIVSDIVMDGVDGYGLLAAVRQQTDLATVPFIFLSARGDRDEVREGMASGADDYVSKPFRTLDLLQAIACRLERRQALEVVQERARDDWVLSLATTLHHELRTPLAEIAAYSELLASTVGPLDLSEFHSLVRGLENGVARLSALVNDVLLLADLRSGRARGDFEARRRRVSDWPSLVDSVIDRYRGLARDRDVVLSARYSGSGTIDADPALLGDAIGRLLDNAIKFSPARGEVRIEAEPHGDMLRLLVADQGPGIEPELVDELTQPLEQRDRAWREQQGMGNGLAICREITRLHGARLQVESTTEGGSTFSMELPLVRRAADLDAGASA